MPSYNPKDLLKLYIYGYMNRIKSSRKLETESKRNIEVTSIIGDTEKGNFASHKVLKNAGSIKFKETEETIWWKIERKEWYEK